MKYLLLCCCLTNLLLADNFYYEFDKKVELKNVIKSDSLSSNDEIQEYVTTSGEAVKFKNEILVQCEKDKYCEDDFESLNPTAENIARWICEQVPHCVKVEVCESEGNRVIYEKD